MAAVMIIILLLFVALIAFLGVKVSNFKNRARQQVLGKTPLGDSFMSEQTSAVMEKRSLAKFLREHPNYSEQIIKNQLKGYSDQIIHRYSVPDFREKVLSRMQGDKRLDRMQNMEFRRINLTAYSRTMLTAIAVYADRRDEYKIFLRCTVNGNQISVDDYHSDKGNALGF